MKDSIIIISTIVGVAAGSAITWFGAIDLAKRQLFNAAAFKFISAFTDEISIIKSENPYSAEYKVFNVLKSAFGKHNAAVVEFRFFLEQKSIPGFDKTWQEYREPCKKYGNNWPNPERNQLNHLTDYISTNDKEERMARRLAIYRIDKLMSYAKTKWLV